MPYVNFKEENYKLDKQIKDILKTFISFDGSKEALIIKTIKK